MHGQSYQISFSENFKQISNEPRSPRDSLFKKKNSGDSEFEGGGGDNDISPIIAQLQNQERNKMMGGEDELEEATGEESNMHQMNGRNMNNSPLLSESDFNRGNQHGYKLKIIPTEEYREPVLVKRD